MYSFLYPSLCHFKQRKSFFLGESNDERIAKQKLLLLFLFSFFGFYKVTNLHWTFGWILVHFSCCILDSCYFLLMGFSYNSFLCSVRERTRLFWRGRKKKKMFEISSVIFIHFFAKINILIRFMLCFCIERCFFFFFLTKIIPICILSSFSCTLMFPLPQLRKQRALGFLDWG